MDDGDKGFEDQKEVSCCTDYRSKGAPKFSNNNIKILRNVFIFPQIPTEFTLKVFRAAIIMIQCKQNYIIFH